MGNPHLTAKIEFVAPLPTSTNAPGPEPHRVPEGHGAAPETLCRGRPERLGRKAFLFFFFFSVVAGCACFGLRVGYCLLVFWFAFSVLAVCLCVCAFLVCGWSLLLFVWFALLVAFWV